MGLDNPLGENARLFSATVLTLVTGFLTIGVVAINAVSVEHGILFIIGLGAGIVFHVISNRTHPEQDDTDGGGGNSDASEEERVSLTDLSDDRDESGKPRDGIEAYDGEVGRDDEEEKDESASTKPVFGSVGGPSGNNRNSGPTNGRR